MGWETWKYLILGTLFWGSVFGVMGGGFTSKFFPAFLNGIMFAVPFIAIALIGEVFGLFKKGEDKK